MRTVRKSRYAIAAAITCGVFLLGMLFGLLIENARVSYIEQQDTHQDLEYNSLRVLYDYIEQLSLTQECGQITEVFDTSLSHLEQARIRLENYDREATINQKEFGLLQREYTQAQLQYWLLAQRIGKMCNVDVSTVLYFYSNEKECTTCESQGFILTYMKKLFNEQLLIFALDGNNDEEPLIPVLKQTYNITQFPAVVVGDKVYQGFTNRETLVDEICTNINATGCEEV